MESYSKSYYQANRDRILALQKERRKDSEFREKMKIYYRNYYKNNRQKILEQSRNRRCLGVERDEKCKGLTIQRGEFIITF
tara:strand:- start:756 stop:998 length:243 start_codon:yes stop_codon:yes gene_type:complete